MLLSFGLTSSWAERIILRSPCPSRMDLFSNQGFFPLMSENGLKQRTGYKAPRVGTESSPSAGCAARFTSRLHVPSGRSVRGRGTSFLQHAHEDPHGQMLHDPTTWIAWNSLPYLNVEQNQPNTRKTWHTDATTLHTQSSPLPGGRERGAISSRQGTHYRGVCRLTQRWCKHKTTDKYLDVAVQSIRSPSLEREALKLEDELKRDVPHAAPGSLANVTEAPRRASSAPLRSERDPFTRVTEQDGKPPTEQEIQPSRTQREKSFLYKSFPLPFPAAGGPKGFLKLVPPEQCLTVPKRLRSFHFT